VIAWLLDRPVLAVGLVVFLAGVVKTVSLTQASAALRATPPSVAIFLVSAGIGFAISLSGVLPGPVAAALGAIV